METENRSWHLGFLRACWAKPETTLPFHHHFNSKWLLEQLKITLRLTTGGVQPAALGLSVVISKLPRMWVFHLQPSCSERFDETEVLEEETHMAPVGLKLG